MFLARVSRRALRAASQVANAESCQRNISHARPIDLMKQVRSFCSFTPPVSANSTASSMCAKKLRFPSMVVYRGMTTCQSSSGIISKEILDTMDGPTAFEAGNYYLAKAYNQAAAASSTKGSEVPDDGARKAVLKEIRVQIKAQRRKLQQGGGNSDEKASHQDPLRMAGELYYHALDQNHYPAAVALGNMFMREDPPNLTEAQRMFMKAADGCGSSEALYNLAQLHYDDGSLDEAFQYFERAAAGDEPSALFWLGYCYHRGVYYDASSKSALKLLRRAGDAGHNGARVYLAQAFRSGDAELGVEVDETEMFRWLDMAVVDKDAEALFIVADMYFHGTDGKEVDYERALQFYLEAGDQSHAPALCCAAAMYYHGLGLPARDFHSSFCMYQAVLDIDPNNIDAFRNVAAMHYYGEGVPVDKSLAKLIFEHVKTLEKELADENNNDGESI